MPRTRSHRQRQTQLTFTPVSNRQQTITSQPQGSEERAAVVCVDNALSSEEGHGKRQSAPPISHGSEHLVSNGKSSWPLNEPVTRSLAEQGNSSSTEAKETIHGFSANRKHPMYLFDDSESDDPVILSSPTKKQRRSNKRRTIQDDFIVEDNDVTVDSSSDNRRSVKTRKRNSSVHVLDTTSESGNSITEGSNQRRHGKRSSGRVQKGIESNPYRDDSGSDLPRVRQKRFDSQTFTEPRSQREREDLEEDLDFLDEADISSPRMPRQQAGSQKQARRDVLQILKQRRLQQAQKSATSAGHSISSERSTTSGSDEHSVEGNGEQYDDMDQSDSGDMDEFIAEDDPEEEQPALPFQFSSYSKMKPKELFKIAVEWMVQKKVNPATAFASDEVYATAFRRLDDYVRGIGSSKFQSSAWTSTFGDALRRRPDYVEHPIPYDPLHDRCDACNRSGHPATWVVQFNGKKYNKETLEDESDTEGDDSAAEDSSSRTKFFIGKANARIAHELAHWRHHINGWVIDYLRDTGELTSSKIVKRDGWSIKKRRKEAERIVDEMENKGEVKRLYGDFKSEIETAQEVNYTQRTRSGLGDLSP